MREIKRAMFKPYDGHLQVDADLHARAREDYRRDLEREREELREALSEMDDVVADMRDDFRVVTRAVKKHLDLENWPEFEGHFAEGVAALLEAAGG